MCRHAKTIHLALLTYRHEPWMNQPRHNTFQHAWALYWGWWSNVEYKRVNLELLVMKADAANPELSFLILVWSGKDFTFTITLWGMKKTHHLTSNVVDNLHFVGHRIEEDTYLDWKKHSTSHPVIIALTYYWPCDLAHK